MIKRQALFVALCAIAGYTLYWALTTIITVDQQIRTAESLQHHAEQDRADVLKFLKGKSVMRIDGKVYIARLESVTELPK